MTGIDREVLSCTLHKDHVSRLDIRDAMSKWGGYRQFTIGELFVIHPTNAYKLTNSDLYAEKGSTPILSNSSMNNGIGGYIELEPTEQGHILTFSDTTTGADTLFYQSQPFIGYAHVQGMYPKCDKWSELSYMYLIPLIRKAAGNGFSYAVKFNRTLVAKLTISLPILTAPDLSPIIDPMHAYSSQGFIPDFAYMEHYIAELEAKRVAELEAYLRAADLNDYELTEDDKEVLEKEEKGEIRKKEFKLGELFEAVNGNVDIQRSMTNGIGVPVVSSGIENNGIIGLTDIPARIIPANTITVDMFGHSFYRDYEYKLVTHARIFALVPKYTEMNSYTNLYIATQLLHLPDIFSYAKMCTYDKVKNMTISLPIDSEGNICFAFMEKYIKAIEKLSIAGVVRYKDRVIEETKKLIA